MFTKNPKEKDKFAEISNGDDDDEANPIKKSFISQCIKAYGTTTILASRKICQSNYSVIQ